MIESLAEGLIDIVVSAHAPAPAEDKRLPFEEAAPGSVGLETLLPALLSLWHEGRAPLTQLIRAVTLAPAQAIGLSAGRLAVGGPMAWGSQGMVFLGEDLMHTRDYSEDTSRVIDAEALTSKSKNSAFDGRRLQGEVLMTLVDGRVVYEKG
jgi:dihydroorotase